MFTTLPGLPSQVFFLLVETMRFMCSRFAVRSILLLLLWSIRIEISSPDHGEMCRLETVVFRRSALQRTGEAVAHVEVGCAHVGREA